MIGAEPTAQTQPVAAATACDTLAVKILDSNPVLAGQALERSAAWDRDVLGYSTSSARTWR